MVQESDRGTPGTREKKVPRRRTEVVPLALQLHRCRYSAAVGPARRSIHRTSDGSSRLRPAYAAGLSLFAGGGRDVVCEGVRER